MTTMQSVGSGSRTTRLLGVSVLVGAVVLLWLGLFATDPDIRVDATTGDEIGQFDAVRLIYVHVPASLIAYLAFTVTTIGSIVVLVKRSVWWDLVAGSSAEIGAVAAALSLITGSIWGRPIWNTWWDWGDVRLLTTLVLFMLSLGYLAVRRLEGTADERARRSAIVGLLLTVNVVIVNRSVEWWENQTLHQQSTIADATIEDLTLFTLFFALVLATAAYAWMLIHRFRLAWLERQYERFGLDDAIERRRAEASDHAAVNASVDASSKGAS
ncbi:MAG: cytochrome c biogenesis protein CcsA [Acidimicrobiales bacterium]